MAVTKTEYKAQIVAFCNRSSYPQANTVYVQVNKLWSDACRELNEFIDAQGPSARLPNGLTADHVKAMPEYKRRNAYAYETGEQCKTFNGVFTRVFKREHHAAIVSAREANAKARWNDLFTA